MNKKYFLILIIIITFIALNFILQNDKKDYNNNYVQPIWVDITSLPTKDE